ncbi:MAG: hypothetical protein HKN16_01545 [Saprospiraceae bacterium]|nr:hypothetical protein [Saprospiraceae bacterium]
MDNPNNLLGVIRTLWRWRKEIIRICGITAIGSIIICLLLPNYYKSTATFYAASPNLAFPEPVGLETRETEYYGEKEDMDRVLTIAESNQVADFLVDKYDLYTHYKIDSTGEKAHYKVLKRFRKLYNVERTKFNAIEISIEDKEKQIAMEIINDAWKKINSIGQTIIKESQRLELATRERTVADKEREMKELNDSLAILRERFGIYNTATQSDVLSSMVSSTENNLILAESKKKIYSRKGTRYRDSVIVADATIAAATEQLKIHKARLTKFNEGMALVESMGEIQEEASGQLGMNRERENQLRSTLASEFSSIYLVSAGELPVNKSRPFRSILVLASIFIAFLFSVIGILLFESYKSVNWKKVFDDDQHS